MNVNGLIEILEKFTRNYLRQVHTIKIGKVTSVNHSSNSLNAEILSDTRYASGVNKEQPNVRDVPYFILSANRGAAKITMPIVAGDLVIILFSDRDYENYLTTDGQTKVSSKNIKTHDYNPILALPCFYTPDSSTEVSSTDIVISNGATSITVAPDGAIDLLTVAEVNVNAATAVNVNTATAVINATAAVSVNTATAVVNATAGITVTSPLLTLVGELLVQGNIVSTGNITDLVRSMAADRVIYNAHSTHPPNDM